ncbi:MAG TPA: carboxylate-amine ligase, partial [Thermoanaerobaculia bacterium]|nr:carboxylate-amine ligase [Thermoanaerobaculia bacterium]
GKLIDFGKREEVPCVALIQELLEFIEDVVDDLGSREELAYVHEILRHGTGADRQVAVYHERNDIKSVVDYIVGETHRGLDL